MKILQINKFFYLKGGSERHFFAVSDLLRQNGHEVVEFSMNDRRNRPSVYADFFIGEINYSKSFLSNIFKFLYNFDANRKLAKLIKQEKPEVAHLHNIYHQLSPSIIHTLKKHKIPMVLTLHDYKVICPNYQLFNKGEICEKCKGGKYYNCFSGSCIKNSHEKSLLGALEAYLHRDVLQSYEKIDKFIAPSYFIKNKFIEFGVDGARIEVIENFTEMMSDSSAEATGDYLLYFGRLSKEKGVNVLLDAMHDVDDVKLKIAGDGPEKEDFQLAIKNFKLGTRVEFVGEKSGDELNNLIRKAKAIVVPSVWYENMPMNILEAVAMGKVIIASRVGGIPEIIEDKENGFLFRMNDTDDLALKIDDLQNNDLTMIGHQAWLDSKRFSADIYFGKYMELIKKIIIKE
ncbi:glycosyltransferase [Candidatus Parcubacteria bacterium]|nr:glycosyltransferase [Patescibacteria group bacterium]MBU4308962.1 glycosyltransferase [Patescibacteria group bacterium]MBU4431868.1 glycosyltransferase [Patescibacteria group bacterium]MBU4577322.1 glycosyltransferase [Patescibacteria group bacterium]MCG2697010.1 glycosyltransferase [Candidatus Parcubacteria bacterium]